ncbi:hypothetical protein [uncultured Gammaproteobacteria bacterium]|nr:hypothetical protein [uncultured Gammaproteobacteria bacterium]
MIEISAIDTDAIVAATAATINFFIIYSVSCEKNLSEIAKMVLIIQVFTVKSTLLCKKNTKDSFFTTKSKNNGY